MWLGYLCYRCYSLFVYLCYIWFGGGTDGFMNSLVTPLHRWWSACGCGSEASADAQRTDTSVDWVSRAAPGIAAPFLSASCKWTPDTAGTSRDQT